MRIPAKIDGLGHQASGFIGRVYTYITRSPPCKRFRNDNKPSVAAIGISAPVSRSMGR
jgi:hypothetical protein